MVDIFLHHLSHYILPQFMTGQSIPWFKLISKPAAPIFNRCSVVICPDWILAAVGSCFRHPLL